MRKYYFRNYLSTRVAYEGEGSGGAGAGAAGAGAGGAGGGTGAGSGGSGAGGAVFSPEQQEQVNRLIAAEKHKYRTQSEQTVRELETLKKQSQMTVEEKNQLQARIDAIKNEHLSKEELAINEHKKTVESLNGRMKEVETERDGWKSKFEHTIKSNEILAAAGDMKAHNPTQLMMMFQHGAKVEPLFDKDNKPTGQYAVKMAIDIGGKVLELAPKEAFKAMRETKEYANLFAFEGSGGVGGKPASGTGELDMAAIMSDPALYAKNREKVLAAAGRR